jgi:NAD(P)-binding Rossmann-like domain
VVVGAGPAGLAASAALSAGGVEHTVLERGRPGEGWRTQRYRRGGGPAAGGARRRPPGPLRGAGRAARPAGDGYALETDGGSVRARTVVVASGDQNLPRVPRLVQALPGWFDCLATNLAAGEAPGLWYLGLKWLTRRRSGILFGFPDDAAAVTDAVRAQL